MATIYSIPYTLSDDWRDNDRLFDCWLISVDRLMINLCGLDHDSVEDWPWRDAFSDGLDPQEAVADWRREVLRDYGVDC